MERRYINSTIIVFILLLEHLWSSGTIQDSGSLDSEFEPRLYQRVCVFRQDTESQSLHQCNIVVCAILTKLTFFENMKWQTILHILMESLCAVENNCVCKMMAAVKRLTTAVKKLMVFIPCSKI